MVAKANSPIAVAMVLVAGNPQLKSCNSLPDPEPRMSVCARKEYNRACHGSPHWHSLWIL